MKSIEVVIKYLKANDQIIIAKGDTLLHWLVRQELFQAVQKTVRIKDDVDIKNEFLETPLHVAVEVGNIPLIKFFLDRGACVDVVNSKGNTPMHMAAYSNFENKAKIIEILLRFNPKLNEKNNYGRTPLMLVCKESTRDWKSVELLMMAGAHITDTNSGWTPLHYIKPNLDHDKNLIASFNYRKIVEIMHLYIVLKRFEDEEWECLVVDSFLSENCIPAEWASITTSIIDRLRFFKEINLANTPITIWDIAVAPLFDVAKMFENRRVRTAAFNIRLNMDNTIDTMVRNKIEFANKKRNFVDACVPYLQKIVNFPLPEECLENIMRYFDERTLQNLLVTYIWIGENSVSANDLFDHLRSEHLEVDNEFLNIESER